MVLAPPGRWCRHEAEGASSYFDRLWKTGLSAHSATHDRYVLHVRTAEGKRGEVRAADTKGGERRHGSEPKDGEEVVGGELQKKKKKKKKNRGGVAAFQTTSDTGLGRGGANGGESLTAACQSGGLTGGGSADGTEPRGAEGGAEGGAARKKKRKRGATSGLASSSAPPVAEMPRPRAVHEAPTTPAVAQVHAAMAAAAAGGKRKKKRKIGEAGTPGL